MSDEKHVGKIGDFYKNRGRMPTYQEIADMVGFASKNAVAKLIDRLEEADVLKRDVNNGRLIPLSLAGDIRVLGIVEAGFPTEVEEDAYNTISLNDYLVKNREATFMFKVKGESMKDAGIFDGDMVLVERTTTARPGQIVIACVDGRFTMKYLRTGRQGYYLEAANDAFPDIRPKQTLKIEAVVKAVIRKF